MSTDSLLGKQLDEYRIEQSLGAGGMAQVYRAIDTKLRRPVALKVIAPNFRGDSDYAVRFEREAQSIARLEHPNIVRIYRFGEVNGLYYMAMQLIEGRDLAHIIDDYHANGKTMPLDEVISIISDIGSALDYAHDLGVIHRDVKPGNIILDKQNHAILTDFGLSLLHDIGTKGEVFGSPHYIAPEQVVSSRNVTAQSDLYSLGVTLFEMLTGELPFSGDDPSQVAMQHLSDMPPRPSQFNPMLPPAVDEVVLKALAKEGADRYQTGKALSEALRQAVQGVQSPAYVLPPPPVIPTRSAKPNPAASTLKAPPAGITQSRKMIVRISPLTVGAAIFGIGLIGLILILVATRTLSNQVAGIPTATTIGTPTAIEISPTVTLTETTQPTPTPLVLGASPISPPSPTAMVITQSTPLDTATSGLPIPADRTTPPVGSIRLGDFAVEGYCNGRGDGVILVNNQSDWACTNKTTGAINFILQPSDFDNICQSKYPNVGAFAIRDQHQTVQAYNWSCYDFPPTLAAIATPSVTTLSIRSNPMWVALVNTSAIQLSLDTIQFQNADLTLTAVDWGVSTLMPGQCIRLYNGDKAPKMLPPDCTQAFDYPGSREVRMKWFKGDTVITLNPATTITYNPKGKN